MLSKAILIGRIGHMESKQTQTGKPMAKISVATNKSWKGKDGQKQEETTWHNIVYFDKMAEIVNQYGVKGDLVYIEGQIQHKEAQDQQGSKRYYYSILGHSFTILSTKKDREESSSTDSNTITVDASYDDVPF